MKNGPVCACGTFAIGRCRECGNAVCGRHSAMHAERLLCYEHWTAAEEAAEKAKRDAADERERARRAAATAELEDWVKSTLDALSDADRIERIIRVAGGIYEPGSGKKLMPWPAVTRVLGDVGSPDSPSWDIHEVIAWFLERVAGVAPDSFRFDTVGFWGQRKMVTVPSWILKDYSDCMSDWKLHEASFLYVLSDGRVWTYPSASVEVLDGRQAEVVGGRESVKDRTTGKRVIGLPVNIGRHGLRQIAEFAGLKVVYCSVSGLHDPPPVVPAPNRT